MAISIARELAKLRNPIQPTTGGTTQGYIEGLSWQWTAANTFQVSTGAAFCPYVGNGHTVVLNTPATLTIPNGAANSRVHLWLHDDGGVPTVTFDETPLTDNYWGTAYRHNTNKGWRYIGSVQRGSGGGPFNQKCVGDRVYYLVSVLGAPFEIVNTTGQTAARTVSLTTIVPGSTVSFFAYFGGSAAVWRVAASFDTVGFTVSNAAFTHVANPPGGVLEVELGSDFIMQYASDAAGGILVCRVTGYKFKR